MTERGSRYLFHIVEEVDQARHAHRAGAAALHRERLQPAGHVSAKASGMWQFMPATGRDFDLRRTCSATTGATCWPPPRRARLPAALHGMFGDWHLALAAYNWGQGNVQRAIARNQKAGLPTDYLSLRMPDETRNYVPKLQAVKNIVAQPAALRPHAAPLENHPYFLSVPIERDIDVALAARLAGMTLDEFKQLNPQMNKPVILAAGTPQLLLPYDNANHFVRNWRAPQRRSSQRVGDGAQVHVLQLAAGRHAARQPRDLQAARAQRLGQRVRRDLAFGREAGGQDDLLAPRRRLARSSSGARRCRHAHAVQRAERPISTKYRPR
jgi:hypothetical protein